MALLLCTGKTTSFPFTFDTTLEQIRKWNLSKQSNEVSSCMIKFFRPHLRRSKIGFANPSSRHQCFLHPAIPPSLLFRMRHFHLAAFQSIFGSFEDDGDIEDDAL